MTLVGDKRVLHVFIRRLVKALARGCFNRHGVLTTTNDALIFCASLDLLPPSAQSGGSTLSHEVGSSIPTTVEI